MTSPAWWITVGIAEGGKPRREHVVGLIAAGVINVRHNSRLHHIGLTKRLRGTKVTVLIDDLDIRVLHHDTGTLIRKLVLDPTRDYQPRGVKCGNSPENRLQMPMMSRDICQRCPETSQCGRCRIRTCVGVSRRIYSTSQVFAADFS
jgi:hypothetical protein